MISGPSFGFSQIPSRFLAFLLWRGLGLVDRLSLSSPVASPPVFLPPVTFPAAGILPRIFSDNLFSLPLEAGSPLVELGL